MTKISHDSETPASGQQVITACAFIHHNFDGVEKLFLPKRAATKKFLPGVFEIPGGHIDFGEDIVEGLKREIEEEFNVKVSVGEPFGCFTYNNEVKNCQAIEVIYFARFINDLEDIKLNPEDHSEYVWLSQDELHKAYTPTKGGNDDEFVVAKRGFSILNGDHLKLG